MSFQIKYHRRYLLLMIISMGVLYSCLREDDINFNKFTEEIVLENKNVVSPFFYYGVTGDSIFSVDENTPDTVKVPIDLEVYGQVDIISITDMLDINYLRLRLKLENGTSLNLRANLALKDGSGRNVVEIDTLVLKPANIFDNKVVHYTSEEVFSEQISGKDVDMIRNIDLKLYSYDSIKVEKIDSVMFINCSISLELNVDFKI